MTLRTRFPVGTVSRIRSFGFTAAILAWMAVLSPSAAAAQGHDPNDRPLLVNLLELEEGFKFLRRRGGNTGVVYTLSRAALSGQQNVQVAFDKNGNGKILRLIQKLTDNATVNALGFGKLAVKLAAIAQPEWESAATAITADVELLMTEYAKKRRDIGKQIPIRGKLVAKLRTQRKTQVAAIDIPLSISRQTRIDRDTLRALVNDATFEISPAGADPLIAYHAPNGRFSGRASRGSGVLSGSWQVSEAGEYCVEQAPKPGWACNFLFREDNRILLVAGRDGRATGRVLAVVRQSPGNTAELPTLSVQDVLDGRMVDKLLRGRTETRRVADRPGQQILYFRDTGRYTANLGGGTLGMGNWAVLYDGRRCLKQYRPQEEPWRCEFLRETDGGTFTAVGPNGEQLGESVYQDGNPYNL